MDKTWFVAARGQSLQPRALSRSNVLSNSSASSQTVHASEWECAFQRPFSTVARRAVRFIWNVDASALAPLCRHLGIGPQCKAATPGTQTHKHRYFHKPTSHTNTPIHAPYIAILLHTVLGAPAGPIPWAFDTAPPAPPAGMSINSKPRGPSAPQRVPRVWLRAKIECELSGSEDCWLELMIGCARIELWLYPAPAVDAR